MLLTIKECLVKASLELKTIDSGNKIALRLLAHTLEQPSTFVWAHPETRLTAEQTSLFLAQVSRASQHEPIEYILGYTDFYGLRFKTTPAVLIPRPETELLVEAALEYAASHQLATPTIVDVGTGCGCVAISLAKHLPQAKVYGIDISPAALQVAQDNARLLDCTNVSFVLGSLTEPLVGLLEPHSVDLLVANLPYISDDEYNQLPSMVRDFEPALALRSGPSADTLNSQLQQQAARWLKPDSFLAYETTNGRIVRPLI